MGKQIFLDAKLRQNTSLDIFQQKKLEKKYLGVGGCASEINNGFLKENLPYRPLGRNIGTVDYITLLFSSLCSQTIKMGGIMLKVEFLLFTVQKL